MPPRLQRGAPPSVSIFVGEDAILSVLQKVSRSHRTGTVPPTTDSRLIVTRWKLPCSVAEPPGDEVWANSRRYSWPPPGSEDTELTEQQLEGEVA